MSYRPHTEEGRRLLEARDPSIPWGLYLSERQWSTVREDDSDSGNAWEYFTGGGLGASHQTGWTGLIALLIQLFGWLDSKTVLESMGHGALAYLSPGPPRS